MQRDHRPHCSSLAAQPARIRRRGLGPWLTVLALGSLLGCSDPEAVVPGKPESGGVRHEIQVRARVVSLSPLATRFVVRLGFVVPPLEALAALDVQLLPPRCNRVGGVHDRQARRAGRVDALDRHKFVDP